MEPLTAVRRLSAEKCEIWAGCQFQTIDQANAAAAVGLKPEQVTINTLAAGGTFGRRANAESDYIAEVASIAKATGGKYPVRLIWTREDDITGGRYRPLNYHRISAGSAQDGKVALRQRVVGQSIIGGHAVRRRHDEERRRSDRGRRQRARAVRSRRRPRELDRGPGPACRCCGGARSRTRTWRSPRK